MAIDSSLFGVDILSGVTYAVGDIVNLGVIDGAANVRSGFGNGVLKNVLVGAIGNASPIWKIHVKNSDWIDDIQSVCTGVYNSVTAFDERAGSNQVGHECNLNENSAWTVYAECLEATTTTSANMLFALIDIDYPSVSGIEDPRALQGIPCSIADNYTSSSTQITTYSTITGSSWNTRNVDYFKAGYKYVLEKLEMVTPAGAYCGFVAFANAAGMAGLQRIIPVNSQPAGVKYAINYAQVLTKGTMDVKVKILDSAGSTLDAFFIHDYVKKSI